MLLGTTGSGVSLAMLLPPCGPFNRRLVGSAQKQQKVTMP